MRDKRLIAFVSGWTKPDIMWTPMAKMWRDQGYDSIVAGYPSRGFRRIQESAKSVSEILRGVRGEYSHVTVIGHSMGGLVGRYIATQDSTADLVDAYVSIGTPHRGTVAAYLAPWSESATQMRPGSQFLGRLEDRGWDSRIPALSLQAAWEEIVLPRNSAVINFGENIVIPASTHGSIILNPQAFWEIWGWLTFDVFGEPGPLYREGFSSRVRSAAA